MVPQFHRIDERMGIPFHFHVPNMSHCLCVLLVDVSRFRSVTTNCIMSTLIELDLVRAADRLYCAS